MNTLFLDSFSQSERTLEMEREFSKQNLRLGYGVEVLKQSGMIIGLDPLSLTEAYIRFDFPELPEAERTFWIDIKRIKIRWRFSDKIPVAVDRCFKSGDWVNISDQYSVEGKEKLGRIKAIDDSFYRTRKVLVEAGLSSVHSVKYIATDWLTHYRPSYTDSKRFDAGDIHKGDQVYITTGGVGTVIELDSKSPNDVRVKLGNTHHTIWLNSKYVSVIPRVLKVLQEREILGLQALNSEMKQALATHYATQ